MKKIFLSGVFLLSASSLLSRLLGLVRDRLLASKFGALSGTGIYDLDAYYVAFRLPDLLFNLLVAGTVSAAFVPIFSAYIQKKDKQTGFEFVNAVINLMVVGLLILCLVLFIGAPWFMQLVAPGFSGEKLMITVSLTRLLLLTPVFFGLSSVAQSIHNTFNTFLAYCLAPIFYNLSILAGIIWLSPKYGVYGVGMGVVMGSVLHFLIQVPGLYKNGWRYRWYFETKRHDVRQLGRLLLPRIFGASVSQLMLLIDTMIASTLAVGSVTIINYALNLQSLPLGMIGLSVSIVAFSQLAALAANENYKDFSKTFLDNFNRISYLIVPAAFGLFLMRYEIVTVILRAGKFTADDTILTAKTLGIFAFGLIPQSLVPLLARAFYALQNTKTPVKIGFIAVAVNLVLSVFLVIFFQMGVAGLAVANVLATIINAGLLFLFLREKLGSNWPDKMLKKNAIFFLASLIMTITVLLAKTGWVYALGRPDGFISYFLELIVISSVGAGVYFLITKIAINNRENK